MELTQLLIVTTVRLILMLPALRWAVKEFRKEEG